MKNLFTVFRNLLLITTIIIPVFSAYGQSEGLQARAIGELMKDGSTVEQIFTKQLLMRYPELKSEQKQTYLNELKNNPTFKDIAFDGKSINEIKAKLLPVLKLYGRDNYTEIALFTAERPFLALYREFTLVISTGMLKILSDEELRATAAHELAHEVFIKEYEIALREGDFETLQTVEYKCDLMAVMVSMSLKEGNQSVVKGVKALRFWLTENNIEVVAKDSHPEPDARQKCAKEFSRNLQK